MPNPENVAGYKMQPNSERAAKFASQGGKASGQARRAKKDARAVAQMVLNLHPDLSDKALSSLKRMGLRGKSPDVRIMATMAIGQKAMQGDRHAYAYLLELAGEVIPGELPADLDTDALQDVQSLADLINNPADARAIDTILNDDTAPEEAPPGSSSPSAPPGSSSPSAPPGRGGRGG